MVRLVSSSCANTASGADSSIMLSQPLVPAVMSLNQQQGSSPALGSQAKITAKLEEAGSAPWEFQKQRPSLTSQWLWVLEEKNHLFQHHSGKKNIVKYMDFEVVGKYHYPFTDDSLAFITCDREAACGNACKDTFPTESRKSPRFTLTCHTSYLHTSWPAGSYCPLLWAVMGLVPLAFLLSRTSQ